MRNAKEIITRLELQPHPEGGYYRETYRSAESIGSDHLPARFLGDRSISTCIYYLLKGKDYSGFHRILSDETWHHYSGRPLIMYQLNKEGLLIMKTLGKDILSGQEPQVTIAAGSWFAAHVADLKGWSLVGCTVAPGFDFRDFEMGERNHLCTSFPEYKDLITQLTK